MNPRSESGQRLSTSRAGLIAILFLLFLPFGFFWRATLGLQTLGDQDAVFWFFPAYQLVVNQIHAFELPLWNPYVFSGMPLLAVWQAGVFDPLNWLYIVFGVSSRTLTLVQELSFTLSALSTFAYSRSIGLGRRASLIASVVYGFGGYPIARTLYPALLHVTALTPLVLFAIERCYQQAGARKGWRWSTAGAGIVAWQLFAGHPQPFIYSSVLAVTYALFSVTLRGHLVKGVRLRIGAQCAAIFAAGAGLAAVQILPAWEFARESVRQNWSHEMFTVHSLHPLSLLGSLIPFFHGGGLGIYKLPYWGNYWHHNEAQIYLGAVALGLAVAGAIGAWRAGHRIGMFWSGVAVIAVLASLGKYVGPLAWALYHVPILNSFRSPNRHWMEVALAVSMLAAYAMDRLLCSHEERLGRTAVLATGMCLVLVTSIGVLVVYWRETAEGLIKSLAESGQLVNGFLGGAGFEFWIPVVSASLALLLLLCFVRSQQRGRWYPALLVFLLIDFNLYATFAPIASRPRLEEQIGSAMPTLESASSNDTGALRSHVLLNPSAGEFSPLFFFGHEMATGYDPLLSARYKTFSGIDEAGRSHLSSLLGSTDQTLDLLSVRHLLVAPNILSETSGDSPVDATYRAQLKETSRWRVLATRSAADRFKDFIVFENQTALPRAWLVLRAAAYSDEDQLDLIHGGKGKETFSPREMALVTFEDANGVDSLLTSSSTSVAEGTVRTVTRSANAIEIEAETAQTAMLVLSELYDRGWHATVDGRAAKICRVNFLLRGVRLEAGRHVVKMWYSPWSARIGALVSVTTVLFLLVVFVCNRR